MGCSNIKPKQGQNNLSQLEKKPKLPQKLSQIRRDKLSGCSSTMRNEARKMDVLQYMSYNSQQQQNLQRMEEQRELENDSEYSVVQSYFVLDIEDSTRYIDQPQGQQEMSNDTFIEV